MTGETDTVDQLLAGLQRSPTVERRGRVTEILGTTLKVTGIAARIGDSCEVVEPATGLVVPVEVVGIAGVATILTPLADVRGLSVDAEVVVRGGEDQVPFGDSLLGRVLDGRGPPIDGKGELQAGLPRRPLHSPAPQPMERQLIDAPLPTGVRAIDTLLTLGRGQRMGVFAAAGGGKSTLLGMLARFATADVIVIALIGERGREVREFIEDSLGADGLARSVIVCATSDRAAMERVRAAHHATAIAEGFRAEGKNVLLLMDSVTRFARALREIGLAAGEPPVRRGFPPSVFAELPRLFERAGNDASGSITAIYTVLLEDEDEGDPVGEEVRSILDGHIVLSRKLGAAGHYPAIDVLGSLSRVFPRVTDRAHKAAATKLRALLAKHAEIEFLVQVGEYRSGADPSADRAIAAKPEIDALLRQEQDAAEPFATSLMLLRGVAGMNAAERRRQMRLLVRLREVRLQGATRALAEARTATARAESERSGADLAATAADVRLNDARGDLTLDPAEAERLLAILDQERFRQSVARSALNDAREAERLCAEAEAERRRTLILARLRHEQVLDRSALLERVAGRRTEERQAIELDDEEITMTRISTQPPARAPNPARGQQPGDVRAMQDALASARDRMAPAGTTPNLRGRLPSGGLPKGDKGLGAELPGHKPGTGPAQTMADGGPPPQSAFETQDPGADLLARRRELREQGEGGLALGGPAGAPQAVTMVAMPSPQADPAAFAQMMADLWTRENGRGAKEVTVRFGERAWPATGARLLRNAAGALDITLIVGAQSQGQDLSGLEDALNGAGIQTGALTVATA